MKVRWGALAVAALVLIGGSTATAAAAATVASITLSPKSGPAGASITVTGSGFAKSAKGTITAGSTVVSLTTSSTGSFSKPVTIPAASVGSVTVSAKVGTATRSSVYSVVVPQSAKALRFGVSTPGGPLANAELDAVGALVGEAPSLVLWYADFSSAPPIAELDSVSARGATSLLTWEPWLWSGGVEQPAFANERIAAGDFDAYISQWATALDSWGKPVMLRYGHEMNGTWYPWAEGVNSNAPGSYVAAWRHVHDIFVAAGADNVSWVWSPNIPFDAPSSNFSGLYPGNDVVDVAALDGYNWGTSTTWSAWSTPATLFDDGLALTRSVAPGKPIVIAETASSELGGSKADWNSSLVAYLDAQPDVTGLVWFNHNKETDWRIDSSPSSALAFKTALANRN